MNRFLGSCFPLCTAKAGGIGVPGPGSYELAGLWPQKPKPNVRNFVKAYNPVYVSLERVDWLDKLFNSLRSTPASHGDAAAETKSFFG